MHALKIETGSPRLQAYAEGALGWIVFNNPDRLNALSIDMWQAIPIALAALEAAHDVRVIVFRGAGERAFVSGADISQFEEQRADADANARYAEITDQATRAMQAVERPTIAMIRGFCLGGGLGVALSCDIRIAAADARFAIPAARLGLGYGFDGVRTLVSLIGPAHTRELLFSARRYEADEAQRIGLVNRVAPIEALEAQTRALADDIAANAPLTIRAAKRAVAEALKDGDARDEDAVEFAIDACFASDDYREGRAAFKEKRPPRFLGR